MTATVTSMFASLIILFAIISNDDVTSVVVKVGLALLVIIVSVVTIFGRSAVKDDCYHCWIMMIGAMFFLVLGGAGMVWNIHLSISTGHNEGHFFLFFMVLITQGAATIYLLLRDLLNDSETSPLHTNNILMF